MIEEPLPVFSQETEKIQITDVEYIPALYNIFNEILVNARDQVIRLQSKKSKNDIPVTLIKVEIDSDTGLVSILNDGSGIDIASHPTEKNKKGKEGIKEFLGTLSTTQEVVEFEPREYFSNGDRVVAVGHFRFKVIETGNEWASDFAMAYTVTDGLISHWRGIFDMTAESIAYQS